MAFKKPAGEELSNENWAEVNALIAESEKVKKNLAAVTRKSKKAIGEANRITAAVLGIGKARHPSISEEELLAELDALSSNSNNEGTGRGAGASGKGKGKGKGKRTRGRSTTGNATGAAAAAARAATNEVVAGKGKGAMSNTSNTEVAEIARELGISEAKVRRYLKELETLVGGRRPRKSRKHRHGKRSGTRRHR